MSTTIYDNEQKMMCVSDALDLCWSFYYNLYVE